MTRSEALNGTTIMAGTTAVTGKFSGFLVPEGGWDFEYMKVDGNDAEVNPLTYFKNGVTSFKAGNYFFMEEGHFISEIKGSDSDKQLTLINA